MKGIVAKDTKNISVINSTFQDLDVAIELENVEGFNSNNNRFIETPEAVLNKLVGLIQNSNLPQASQKHLLNEIISLLKAKSKLKSLNEKKESLKRKILLFLGDKGVDLFNLLVVAAVTGQLKLK